MNKTILKLLMQSISTESLNQIYDAADEEMWSRGEKKDVDIHEFKLLQPSAEPCYISQEECQEPSTQLTDE